MAATTTSAVYIQVIEDVINKVREEFVNNAGPGDDVLKELQGVISLLLFFRSKFVFFDSIYFAVFFRVFVDWGFSLCEIA